MRQRTTIYNPYSSHDGIIINLNRTNFQLSSIPNYPFIIENKYTIKQSQESYENKLYLTIKQLRIQTKFINKSGSPIFSFNYQSGLNIYVVPYFNVDKLKFWKQVEQLIEKLLNIKIDQKNWIQNGNSFYYYDIQPIELKEINFNLNSYSNSNSNLNLNIKPTEELPERILERHRGELPNEIEENEKSITLSRSNNNNNDDDDSKSIKKSKVPKWFKMK